MKLIIFLNKDLNSKVLINFIKYANISKKHNKKYYFAHLQFLFRTLHL